MQARSRGYSPEQVARAALPGHYSWAGLESDLWQGWMSAFEQLENESDVLKPRLDRAVETEREVAVRGHWRY